MLEKFENAWRQQSHRKGEPLHTEIENLLLAVNRERRRGWAILTICSLYTLATTIGTAYIYSQRNILLTDAWPVAAAQAIALVVLAYLLRTNFLPRHPVPASLRSSAESALAANNARIAKTKLVAFAMAAILLLSVVAMGSLVESGKMDSKAVWSMTAVLVLIAVFNGSILMFRWKRELKPRRDRVLEILKGLE